MRDHTSLKAWQEAQWVALAVVGISRDHWKPFLAAIFAQLQKASLSVQLNIAEGYAFTTSPSFLRHLTIAYGSSVETGELLELLRLALVVPEETIVPILDRCHLCQRLVLGLLKRTRERIRNME